MDILIVEDNPAVRQLLRSMVSGLAHAVHECSDGSEALAAYAAFHPDWVLMDIELPGLDGIAATGAIKAAFPDAHVCIVTQYDDWEMREAARRAGAEGYVVKEDLTAVWQVLDPRRP